jgi:hypothetical protein
MFSMMARPLLPCGVLVLMALVALACGCSQEELGIPGESTAIENQTSLIIGTVFNADEGQPVQNASVQIIPGFESTSTDKNGSFLFDNLGSGEFRVLAHQGNYSASVEINTQTTRIVSIDITFGTTALNPNDFSFRESPSFLTKKLLNEDSPDLYLDLIADIPLQFLDVKDLDWNPVKPMEILISAKVSGEFYKIYRYNMDSRILTPLVSAPLDALHPSYAPDGKRFCYASGGEIFLADTDRMVADNQRLIRDQALIFRDPESRLVLAADLVNEAAGRPVSLPIIPAFPAAGGALGLFDPTSGQPLAFVNPVTGQPVIDPITGQIANTPSALVASEFYRDQLNQYFNFTCVLTLPQFPCTNRFLHFFDQGIHNDNVFINSDFLTNPNATSFFGYSTPTYADTKLFDALNFPADCPSEFASPAWSPNGNQISFLARPMGCSATRTSICRRPCDDSSWEVFVAPVDSRPDPSGIELPWTTADFERMDKYGVFQITHDRLQDINPSWDPGSNVILYEKVKINPVNGTPLHFLYSSNPTPQGFQTRLLLTQNPVQHHASISPNGLKILWVSRNQHAMNPEAVSQIFLSDWSGFVSNDRPVTFYTQEEDLSKPSFYKVQELAFSNNSIN